MAAGLCLTQDGRCRTVAGGPARSAPLALCPYLDVHKPPQPRVWVPRDGTLAAETSRFARLPALRLDAATCALWKVATEPRGARRRACPCLGPWPCVTVSPQDVTVGTVVNRYLIYVVIKRIKPLELGADSSVK